MTTTTTEPILANWTIGERSPADAAHESATATAVCSLLGQLDVGDIDPALVPYMAAAAAELALMADIPWRFSADDAPVALLRLIAKAGIRNPQAGGPHTARLIDQLAAKG